MTLEEKIDAFVLAQGNQVGSGAELASILKEIASSATPKKLEVQSLDDFTEVSKEDVLSAFGITEAELDALCRGEYPIITLSGGEIVFYAQYMTIEPEIDAFTAVYGVTAGNYGAGFRFMRGSADDFSLVYVEA